MPKTVELVVSLKMPDATAITALQTLQKLGFNKIKDAKRSFYYKFTIDGNEEDFENKKDNYVKVLVKNTDDDGSGILSTLKDRLGFNNIKKVESAVMWGLLIDGNEKEAGKTAEKAAKDLLVNEHYQEFTII